MTYSLYFSSANLSLTGIPDKKSIIKLVKIGEAIAIHSIPLITFKEMTNTPHHITISPK